MNDEELRQQIVMLQTKNRELQEEIDRLTNKQLFAIYEPGKPLFWRES